MALYIIALTTRLLNGNNVALSFVREPKFNPVGF